MYYVVIGSDPINMKTIASPPTFLFVVGKFIAINAFTGLSFYLSAVAVITIRKGPFFSNFAKVFLPHNTYATFVRLRCFIAVEIKERSVENF